MNFTYHLPVNLIFGRKSVNKLGGIATHYGKTALVVTGKSSTKKTGLLDRILEQLSDVQIRAIVFDKVTQNPLTTTAIEGAKIAIEESCSMVIGVGGGSIMDCAKAIAFMAVNQGSIHDYIFNKSMSDRALPIILIPTTCGTGSEGNGFAVLTNPETGDKKSLRTNAIIAKASIIDSELMETMPKEILASVGFDALCHCMEAYTSKLANPIVEAMCLKGMEYIVHSLIPLYKNTQAKLKYWDELSMASTIGGMVIHSAGVALPHGMEHPASGLKNIVHGKGLAALTPAIVRNSQERAPEKYAVISRILGGRSASDCSQQISEFLDKIHLKTSLSELGITSKDIPWMCENCYQVSEASIKNHPVLFNKDQIYQLYDESL